MHSIASDQCHPARAPPFFQCSRLCLGFGCSWQTTIHSTTDLWCHTYGLPKPPPPSGRYCLGTWPWLRTRGWGGGPRTEYTNTCHLESGRAQRSPSLHCAVPLFVVVVVVAVVSAPAHRDRGLSVCEAQKVDQVRGFQSVDGLAQSRVSRARAAREVSSSAPWPPDPALMPNGCAFETCRLCPRITALARVKVLGSWARALQAPGQPQLRQ